VAEKSHRRLSALERVRNREFPVALRGYDRRAVDEYVGEVAQLVAELEATQLRESVIQKALDEVGQQTSAILQRANESADEIAARSRSQAEGRLQRAEREAEVVRSEADEYARQVAADVERTREDRLRLIEDLRRLAEEVLGVADDALERLPEPERQPEPEPGATDEATEVIQAPTGGAASTGGEDAQENR
jgi:cell division initiation protein